MNARRKLYQVGVPYALAGIETTGKGAKEIVVKAAPIYSWMLSQQLSKIKVWAAKQGGYVQEVKEKE